MSPKDSYHPSQAQQQWSKIWANLLKCENNQANIHLKWQACLTLNNLNLNGFNRTQAF